MNDVVRQLLTRARDELAEEFDFSRKYVRVCRAPGRLDVMGGIADYTGSLVCEATLDRAAAVVVQPRTDGVFAAFSLNLRDEHQPWEVRVGFDELEKPAFSDPSRKWAGYLLGCFLIARDEGLLDLRKEFAGGASVAVLSDVPLGAGVSSSAAIEVATMTALLRDRTDGMTVARLCQRVENLIVGAPCGIMDQVTSCLGREDSLLTMLCQPHELREPLKFPRGVRAVGINSNVKHSVGGGMYGRTRCAAFMAHAIILHTMKQMADRADREMVGDPTGGYLANLDPEDYKKFFRPRLPEQIGGREFLQKFGPTRDTVTRVDESTDYHVQSAADHHVLEARRVRNFVDFLREAGAVEDQKNLRLLLDKAGHMMYASHSSYGEHARLGAPECDLLVELVRKNERGGLYGAKITGGGSGGTVAVLCDASESADQTIEKIAREYEQQTGRKPDLFLGSSPGAWWSEVIQPRV